MGLAGIMFWAVDLDDFISGFCNEGKYPLMNTAINIIRVLTKQTRPSVAKITTDRSTSIMAQQRKRIVCYYTRYVICGFFDFQKMKFQLIVGHKIVLKEEDFHLKILMLHYVHILFMHLLFQKIQNLLHLNGIIKILKGVKVCSFL